MKTNWTPFAWGFRPFFLVSGLYGVLAIGAWLVLYGTGSAPFDKLPPSLWHAHEMLYGFVGAAIAGFLLTAVPNWTGTDSIAGKPLMLLALAWLAGRIGLALAGWLPWGVVAILAAAFMPGICYAIYRPLIGSRNLPLVVLLLIYWLSDLAFMFAVDAQAFGVARLAIETGTGIVLILLTIIGGRILPAFTANALRARGIEVATPSSPHLDRVVLAAMIVYVGAGILQVPPVWTSLAAGSAGALQFIRFVRWHGHKSWRDPIVWILHVAYVALPAGLLLRAVFAASGATWAAHWQHVLTIGALSTMIMAVMTRAALGHTGRPLKATKAVTIGYVALIGATVTRSIAPSLLPAPYVTTINLAGALWIVAFSIFTVVYAPILTRPRIDAEPG